MKYRDKLSLLMAGPAVLRGGDLLRSKADYKGGRALKSCHSEFHHILWCGPYKRNVRRARSAFFIYHISGKTNPYPITIFQYHENTLVLY